MASLVAQTFLSASSGDFPVASSSYLANATGTALGTKHGTRMSREPADRNVCATICFDFPLSSWMDFLFALANGAANHFYGHTGTGGRQFTGVDPVDRVSRR